MNTEIGRLFIIVPPGFEIPAEQELCQKWTAFFPSLPLPQLTRQKGGLEFEAPLEQALLCNLFLKIPVRILLRLSQFKCRDFPKLYNKLVKMDWRRYLRGQIPTIHSSSFQSRLFDSSRIEKTVSDALVEYYRCNPPKKAHLEALAQLPSSGIYLRFENDLCSVSIDTSGERLGVRGYRSMIGKAPLRENLAAGLLYYFSHMIGEEAREMDLIDPMCGAGTFPLEAQTFFHGADMEKRLYAFQYFPNVKTAAMTSNPSGGLFKRSTGMDIDTSMIELAKANLEQAPESGAIQFRPHDFFLGRPSDFQSDRIAMIINPPYGVRLKTGEDNDQYFTSIIKTCREKYQARWIGIIVPRQVPSSKMKMKGMELASRLPFENGGLKVQFLVFKNSSPR